MRRCPLIMYDLVGGAVTIGVAALGVWCGLLHPRTTSAHLSALQSGLAEAKSSLHAAENAMRRKSSELAALEENIKTRGALPASSPVEADLRALARLAHNNRVELTQIKPAAGKQYPGITELRYQVQGRSTFEGLLGFLRDFRTADFWADITQLKISSHPGTAGARDKLRASALRVSLFASHHASDTEVDRP